MAEVEVIKIDDTKEASNVTPPYTVVRKHHTDSSKYKTPHQSKRECQRRVRQYTHSTEAWPVSTAVHLQLLEKGAKLW